MRQDSAPHYDCAHTGCRHSAILRRKVNNIVVALCSNHHQFHASTEAREYTASIGLKTVAELRIFCKTPQFAPPSKKWAHALKARHDAGEVLSTTQIEMMRAALKSAFCGNE